MKKFRVLASAALAIIAAASMTSCTMTTPISATSNPVGSKVGVSEGSRILIYWFGETGIRQAAKLGGISKISTVDFKEVNILGVYSSYSCIVTGE
jgi:hypothetical protein